MREQKGWTEHANFMNMLEHEHFVVLGGPLRYHKHRALLVAVAPNEQALCKRLGEDLWMRTEVLKNIEIYPWEILIGKIS